MNYNLWFDYSSIGIMLFTLFFLVAKKDLKKKENRILLVLACMNLFSTFADIIAIYVQSDVPRFGLGPGKFWNTVYLFVHTQMGVVLVHYVLELLGLQDKVRRWQRCLMLLPSGVVLFVLACNPFLEWYFYYNEQNIYTYGPMMPVVFGGPFVQLLVVLVLVIRYRRVFQRNMILAISFFFLLTMAAVAFQLVHREMLVELYAQSLAILGMMLATDNKDEIRSLVATMHELDEERERAEEANRSKSDFLASMSHEIRTPINAVLGMNEMILRESTQAKQEMPATREGILDAFGKITVYAGDIRSAGQNLLSIINDILDFSKIESGKMELVEAEYKMSSVLNDVSNMILFRASAKKLEFRVDVDETLPDGLFGDEVRVRQILTNVLGNAVKYTEEGSVTLTVRGKTLSGDRADAPGSFGEESTTAPKERMELEVSVRDTGIGIRDEDIGKLFGKFERVDTGKTKTIEGTGLGLAITQSLIRMMNGTIRVESEYGIGSEFIVTIPQRVTDTSPVGNFRKRFEQGMHETKVYRETFRAPEARILVVDDTPVNLTVIRGLLAKTQLKINTATSGAQALEMTKDIPFDIILMDQRMPEMDGTETMKRIRSQEDGANTVTPVIALTADVVQGARTRYLEAGFSDFLSKPVEGIQLEEKLMEYLPEEKIVKELKESTSDGRMTDGASGGMSAQTEKTAQSLTGEGKHGLLTDEVDTTIPDSPEEARRIIAEEAPALIEAYRALKKMLAPVAGGSASALTDAETGDVNGAPADVAPPKSAVPDKPEMDPEELLELYEAILEFAEGYDLDSIDALLAQAKAYTIPAGETERFAQVSRCVRGSDWDGLRELLGSL